MSLRICSGISPVSSKENARSDTSNTFVKPRESRCSLVRAPRAQIAVTRGSTKRAAKLVVEFLNGPKAWAAFTVGTPNKRGTPVISVLYTKIGNPRPSTKLIPATSTTTSEFKKERHTRVRTQNRGRCNKRHKNAKQAIGNSIRAKRSGSIPTTRASAEAGTLGESSFG